MLQHFFFFFARVCVFVCVYIYLCVSVFVQPFQNWNTQLLRGRPATHVSPEGEETRHHIGGKEKEKRQTEGRNGEKHN